jgi:hypothetical protein
MSYINVKYCRNCGEQIHPKRLEIIPTAVTCVPCSTVKKKGAVTLLQGEGDHTWVETIFLEHDEYQQYVAAENKLRKITSNIPKADYDEDDSPSSDLPSGFNEIKLEE